MEGKAFVAWCAWLERATGTLDSRSESLVALGFEAGWEACRATAAAPTATGGDDADLVERLAALSHEQWSGWTHWMMEKWDATHASGESFRDRWRRQMETPYADLPELERESDRIEARKILALLRDAAPRPDATGGRLEGARVEWGRVRRWLHSRQADLQLRGDQDAADRCWEAEQRMDAALGVESAFGDAEQRALQAMFDRATSPATAAEGEG